MELRYKVDNIAGKVCKFLLPIKVDCFVGSGSNVSVCTLSSIDLLIKISTMPVMSVLKMAGRLYSENKGIDQIISFCIKNPQMKYILLCGKDGKGHFPGHALISLIKNGVSEDGRILGTTARYPFLCSSKNDIDNFVKQISIIDLRDCFDENYISSIALNLIG